jgi:hypothetical protein
MKIKIKLQKSPDKTKKYRVTLPNGKSVNFGLTGYSDYTLHKNPLRMRSYVMRHGGDPSLLVRKSTNPKFVQDKMLNITASRKENWTKNGINTAGFWSRWLLWSHPTIPRAKREISKRFNVSFME